jgi:hypothetical protein
MNFCIRAPVDLMRCILRLAAVSPVIPDSERSLFPGSLPQGTIPRKKGESPLLVTVSARIKTSFIGRGRSPVPEIRKCEQ